MERNEKLQDLKRYGKEGYKKSRNLSKNTIKIVK